MSFFVKTRTRAAAGLAASGGSSAGGHAVNDSRTKATVGPMTGAMGTLGEAESVKLAWKPNITVEVDEANAGTLLKLVDTLDDDDDVQTVWGNYEIPDAVMEKLG